MRRYIAYIRVSTVRQGEKGASLPEQKAVIEAYARREGLSVWRWYEEMETAAKTGRTLFKKLLQSLDHGEAHGLILHKIDRGARNLKDWASLAELADRGIDIRIAGDALDLNSRGGRLSADIQAVVAADYIRNLREEVKKGQRGRLSQGLYPWRAPLGYKEVPAGLPKEVDPHTAPLVRKAFEAYATGEYTLGTLSDALVRWGLKSDDGRPMTKNRLNNLLRRSFYMGLIEIKGVTYIGRHEPLVSTKLFKRVQTVLDGRSSDRLVGVRAYALRQLVTCSLCNRKLYAETQKGSAYFRCHSLSCRGTCIRESQALSQAFSDIRTMGLSAELRQAIEEAYEEHRSVEYEQTNEERVALKLRRAAAEDRATRLTDAYIDKVIEKTEYEERKKSLNEERLLITEQELALDNRKTVLEHQLDVLFELISSLQELNIEAGPIETGRILKAAISNFSVSRKTIDIQWKSPFHLLKMKGSILLSGDVTETHRTSEENSMSHREVAEKILDELRSHDASLFIS